MHFQKTTKAMIPPSIVWGGGDYPTYLPTHYKCLGALRMPHARQHPRPIASDALGWPASPFLKRCFLMWTTFKVLIECVFTILPLF